jgi:hypothetical protein
MRRWYNLGARRRQDDGERGARHHSQTGGSDHWTPHLIRAAPAAGAPCRRRTSSSPAQDRRLGPGRDTQTRTRGQPPSQRGLQAVDRSAKGCVISHSPCGLARCSCWRNAGPHFPRWQPEPEPVSRSSESVRTDDYVSSVRAGRGHEGGTLRAPQGQPSPSLVPDPRGGPYSWLWPASRTTRRTRHQRHLMQDWPARGLGETMHGST